MNSAQVFTFKIGGEAGFGIMAAGNTFSKIAARSGYHIFDYTEYPSLIRGGHNVMQTTFSLDKVYAQYKSTDFLVALNQQTIELHKNELAAGSGVLYDSDYGINVDELPEEIDTFAIPLTQIIKDADGSMVMRNSAAIAAAITLLGSSLDHLKELIAEEFKDKNPEITEMNYKVCEAAKKYVLENYANKVKHILVQQKEVTKQIIVTANEAAALGALAGGMNFASIYPMTPTSNILHALAPLQEKYNFIYKQPEDEISAINMAIGASFAGARAMVATSGGGFCLMSEGYGLAGITETPIVIIEGMRGAPATGLPTWTEQGDLRFVLHAHQGDFPRIVLAAGDMEESYTLTRKAFNLAEKYQTPVLILVDKYICESHSSINPFTNDDFEIDRGEYTFNEISDNLMRYIPTSRGISMRTFPGTGNHFVANSDEHDSHGFSSEDAQNRIEQMNKRMHKLVVCEQEDMEQPKLYGPEDAELTIVSWGSNKGPILETLKALPNVNYLHLTWINPFPAQKIKTVLEKSKNILNLECNYSAQMNGLIKEKTGIDITNNFLKYDGRPFYPEEIFERAKGILK